MTGQQIVDLSVRLRLVSTYAAAARDAVKHDRRDAFRADMREMREQIAAVEQLARDAGLMEG